MFALKTYLLISLFIAIGQVVDGLLLLRSKGSPRLFNLLFSIGEFFWIIASISVIINRKGEAIYVIPAILYILHSAAAFFSGTALVKESEDIETIIIPKKVSVNGIIFGIFFYLVCALLYFL